MNTITLSPYFTKNTTIVSNFCRKCYSTEEEIFITGVNVSFLKKYDSKYHQLVLNNFFLTPDAKSEKSWENSDVTIDRKVTKLNYEQKIFKIKRLMKIKARIFRKYSRFYRNKKISRELVPRKVKEEIIGEKLEKEDEYPYKKMNNSKVSLNKQLNVTIKQEITDKVGKVEENNLGEPKKESKWIPPISPHNLIEEKYYNDPWALLVVTIFLNRTSCLLALPYMDKFFEDFKGPYDVLKVKIEDLEQYFTKIGLIKTRATQVWKMSFDFVNKDWKNVGELYGVGKYAEDAYRMFHLGDFSVEPTDRYLKIYKTWYQMKKTQEDSGIFVPNSQVYLEDYYIGPECEDRSENP